MKTLQIKDLKCTVESCPGSESAAYIVYPEIEGLSETFQTRMARKYGVNVVTVYVPAPQWNNYLTPWPAPPESEGFPPFDGKANDFLGILTDEIVPQAEKALGLQKTVHRDLIGVSLSGLFTLWQWMRCDVFHSIGSLSGSFWYEGFLNWFEGQAVPPKSGKAYFLLGVDEPKAKIKAYRSVGDNTLRIVERLKEAGVAVRFEWVPGNHFSEPVGRLEKAFEALFLENNQK